MKEKNKIKYTFRHIFRLLAEWKLSYLACVICLAALFAFERPFTAFIFKWLSDSILGGDLPFLRNVVIINLLLLLFWIPSIIIFQYLWRKVLIKAMADLRQRIFGHFQRLSLSYHENRHSGDLVSVITNDVGV